MLSVYIQDPDGNLIEIANAPYAELSGQENAYANSD